MNIVVCGSRKFDNYQLFKSEMDEILSGKKNVVLVSGGAKGADSMAKSYANRYGYEFHEILAEWDLHGKKAGMLRNLQLLDVAETVVAFWDGRSKGTGHMIKESIRRNIPLVVVDV